MKSVLRNPQDKEAIRDAVKSLCRDYPANMYYGFDDRARAVVILCFVNSNGVDYEAITFSSIDAAKKVFDFLEAILPQLYGVPNDLPF